MRYKMKPKVQMKEGTIRTRTHFLFWPKCIDREWRWWEMGTYYQQCTILNGYNGVSSYRYYDWVNTRWSIEGDGE
jgi:hypothetical protein